MSARDTADGELQLRYDRRSKAANSKHPIKTAEPAKMQMGFKNRKAGSYKRMLRWIDDLTGPPHPGYRLKYKPPFGIKLRTGVVIDLPLPTTQPATGPAGEDDFFK